MNIDNL